MKKRMISMVIAALLLLPAGWAMGGNEAATSSGTVTSKSFTVNKGDRLVVYADEGDIIVRGGDKDTATFTASGLDERDVRGLNISQAGNVVRLEFEEMEGQSRHVRFEISVPLQFNMDLETAGGDIQLQGNFNG